MSLLPHQLELLSPARDADIGIEAVNHGADAVYIGGPAFGARATAGNDIRDLERLIKHAHRFGSRIFITLNTILRDDELQGARDMAWQIYNAGADALIIQDPTLLHQLDLFSGLSGNGYILINSTRSLEELGMDEFTGRFPRHHCCTVPASELALKHVGRPLPNAALLGAFAAVSGQFRLDSVLKAIRDKFAGRVGEANAAAAQAAYDLAEQPQRRKVTDA